MTVLQNGYKMVETDFSNILDTKFSQCAVPKNKGSYQLFTNTPRWYGLNEKVSSEIVNENLLLQGPRSKFRVGGLKDKRVRWASYGEEGGSGGMLPRIILILTPLKCREMHFKLINEFLNCYTVT